MNNRRAKIDQACRVAEDFTKLYYDTMDKRRHLISRLYMDTALLSWNGNAVKGSDEILKFMIELPPTDYNVTALDTQPLNLRGDDDITFLIQTAGHVKYRDTPTKTFQESFLITAQGDKWKIVSDCFRHQEGLSSKK